MRYRAIFLLVVMVLCFACTPPQVQRPLDGAQPGAPSSATSETGAGVPALSGVPPTLSAAPASPSASPSPGSFGGPPASPSPSPEAGYVIVATDGQGANLRESPSLTSRVITTIAEGTVVEVYGETVTAEGRQWRRIRGGNRDGWVVAPVVRRR